MTATSAHQIPNWLEVAARSHPDKPALIFAGQRWTFADLRASVVATTAVLSYTQVESAGRIGILSANRPGVVFTVHAATRMAVPFVPLNWRQTPGELAWQLRDAGITMLVIDEERANMAKLACAGLPVEIVHIAELERSIERGGRSGEVPLIDLEREAMVVYTSGTSGRPKGARITNGNLWFGAVASALHIGHHAEDVWLAAMPLFHVGGLAILFRGAIGAVPVVLHERFQPEHALAAINEGATLVSVVPTMLQRLLEANAGGSWPPSLRCVLLGGSAAPPRLIEESVRRGIPIAPTYGLTEATSQVTTLLPEETPRKPGSSGVPLPLTEVRIVAQAGVAPPGEVGEIEIRGPTLFAGYIHDRLQGSHDLNDGWFRTGDAGHLDQDGYLYIVDRRDDLIVSGGENVYPAEIERVLRQHPSVLDAGVIGVEDESWGSRPVAAVVWRGGSDRASVDLLDHCRQHLPGYKIPDRFLFLSQLPRSPSGKLLRRTLREMVAESP
ncbi:MAG TPA: o-succinylbenzoate--CoA ligase [Thermomicrobiales bacterium]|nr:o-succinylbenzoate--CoA ligase [Thermomicrobiales bacterium]